MNDPTEAAIIEIQRQEDEWAKRNGVAPIDATFVPGYFPNMPAAQYFAIEAMSQSGAKKILRTPQHYRLSRTTPNAPTEAMQFGSAVGCAVLEPDLYGSVVAIAPEVNRRTTAGKTMWAECQALNAGKIVLTRQENEMAHACARAVRAHPTASQLLAGAEVESSLFWNDGKWKVPCKARIDIRSLGGVTDLKTTKDASPDAFAKDAANYGYHIQAGQYFSGCEHVLNATPEFFANICVESEPPHLVAVYRMPAAAILAGLHLMNIAMERYAEALATGAWRGYPETMELLPFPRWALRFNQ